MWKLFLNQFQWYRKWRKDTWTLFQYTEEYCKPWDPACGGTCCRYIWRKGSETSKEIERIGKLVLYKSIKKEDWKAIYGSEIFD